MTTGKITPKQFQNASNIIAQYCKCESLKELTLTQVLESQKIIKLNQALCLAYEETTTVPELLKEFQVILPKTSDSEKADLVNNKNLILRGLVEKMVEETGRFNLNGQIPFKHICPKCHGAGEKYMFYRTDKTIPCRHCDGAGKREWVDANDPETKITVTCKNCNGTGRFKTLAIDAKIKSTTPCDFCEGIGFVSPKQKDTNPLPNPVLTTALAEKIRTTGKVQD